MNGLCPTLNRRSRSHFHPARLRKTSWNWQNKDSKGKDQERPMQTAVFWPWQGHYTHELISSCCCLHKACIRSSSQHGSMIWDILWTSSVDKYEFRWQFGALSIWKNRQNSFMPETYELQLWALSNSVDSWWLWKRKRQFLKGTDPRRPITIQETGPHPRV